MQERFTRELNALRALAREVGERYPEVAHLVSGRAADASVERILQAAALLYSRLSDRIEGDLPELIYPYVDSLWPEELRPRPAATLLSAALEDGYAEQSMVLPAGTSVRARTPGGEVPFVTSAPVELWPVVLEAVDMGRPEASVVEVVLRFRALEGVRLGALAMPRLRLHVLGAGRGILFDWLTHHRSRVELRRLDHTPIAARLRAQPVSGADQRPVWPTGSSAHTPLSRLETYFVLPEVYSAIDVLGLEALASAGDGEGFELAFRVASVSGREVTPKLESFALGGVAAVNLGTSERVDVDVGDGRTELRVRAPEGAEVFRVERVGAYDRRSGEWQEFQPLIDVHGGRPKAGQVCFEVERRPGDVEPGDVYVRITDAEGRPQSPAADRVAVWVVGVDSVRAAAVREGMITLPGPDAPRQVRFEHPVPVRAGGPSPIVRRRLFPRLALLTGSQATLLTRDGLVRLLREAMVDAGDRPERLVRAVSVVRGSHVDHRRVRPSIEVVIDVDEQVLGAGELYLFALVLRDALAAEGYTQLELRGTSGSVRVGTAG